MDTVLSAKKNPQSLRVCHIFFSVYTYIRTFYIYINIRMYVCTFYLLIFCSKRICRELNLLVDGVVTPALSPPIMVRCCRVSPQVERCCRRSCNGVPPPRPQGEQKAAAPSQRDRADAGRAEGVVASIEGATGRSAAATAVGGGEGGGEGGCSGPTSEPGSPLRGFEGG